LKDGAESTDKLCRNARKSKFPPPSIKCALFELSQTQPGVCGVEQQDFARGQAAIQIVDLGHDADATPVRVFGW
jgi:hypothetical protein